MKNRSIPLQLIVGLLLMAIFWPFNWFAPFDWRTKLAFFPLWLGFTLLMDGLVFIRRHTSLLSRSPRRFVALFIVSMPAWWLFELFNLRTENWAYLGRETYTDLEFFLSSSLAFSTVIPAVFEAAELAATFNFVQRWRNWWKIVPTPEFTAKAFVAGWIMLILFLIWPQYFYPLLWVSVIFIIEPINVWLGQASLAAYSKDGDWRAIGALWTGVTLCGFAWEMWNYWAYPKWIYHVPFVSFGKIFEMPILGYFGYWPFALELFVVYTLACNLLKVSHDYFLPVVGPLPLVSATDQKYQRSSSARSTGPEKALRARFSK